MPTREGEKEEMNTFNFYNLIRLCFFVCLPAYLFSLSLFLLEVDNLQMDTAGGGQC